MKINRIFISTDDNPLYIQFLPMFSLAWQRLLGIKPTVAYVGNLDDKTHWMKEYCDDIIYYPKHNALPNGRCQTFAARMLMRYLYPDDICMISDIDMLPLNGRYFDELLANYSVEKFVSSGYNAYKFGDGDPKSTIKDPNLRKFPSCYTIATGKVWKEIINPNGLSDSDIVKSWFDIKYFDHKESVNDPNFDDESLMRALIQKWNPSRDRVIGIDRNIVRTGFMGDRLDRSNWRFNMDMLKGGKYIDAHCPRPMAKYADSMKLIAGYLDIPFVIGGQCQR